MLLIAIDIDCSQVENIVQPIQYLCQNIVLSITVMMEGPFTFFISAFITLHGKYANTKMMIAICLPRNSWNITFQTVHIKCLIVTNFLPFCQERLPARSVEILQVLFEQVHLLLVNVIVPYCSYVCEGV